MINKFTLYLLMTLFSLPLFAGPMLYISSKEELITYLKKIGFNGVVLVAKDKNILMKEAFGYKSFSTKIPLTTSDKFQIGSNTKQFIAASLLKLQEEGRLSLEDKIIKYIPELPQYGNITIRDILNHSSGIPSYTDHKEFWEVYGSNKNLTLDKIIDFVAKFPLEFTAKSKYRYSNSGYIFAGKIIEVVTGKTWDKYLEDNFFKPLGMKNTGFNLNFQKVSDVEGHVLENNQLSPSAEVNLSLALSAGALYSTLDDLLKWTSIYHDSQLLSQDSKKDMQTPYLGDYGLGLWIHYQSNDVLVEHRGSTLGFRSNIEYFKKSRLTIITLDTVDDGKISRIPKLLSEYYTTGQLLLPKLGQYPLPVESIQQYVGEY